MLLLSLLLQLLVLLFVRIAFAFRCSSHHCNILVVIVGARVLKTCARLAHMCVCICHCLRHVIDLRASIHLCCQRLLDMVIVFFPRGQPGGAMCVLSHFCFARTCLFFECSRLRLSSAAVSYACFACMPMSYVFLRILILHIHFSVRAACPAQFLMIQMQSCCNIMLFGIVSQICSCRG